MLAVYFKTYKLLPYILKSYSSVFSCRLCSDCFRARNETGMVFTNASCFNGLNCWSSHGNVPAGVRGVGQQLFYGQQPPTFINPLQI
ncbi:hypothetical protein CFC21_065002 [Triticum aestivum]|uniref:Uncharacterized protein n=3 Tax=Triticum TaxID=4564 RepID=A0A9R0TLA6_TRITD|nr:hypothetical protein CFC21_065002 [Triticum aestivum]VAI15334.1 unnamed protein product [Triticum turgidum subsp. durum]